MDVHHSKLKVAMLLGLGYPAISQVGARGPGRSAATARGRSGTGDRRALPSRRGASLYRASFRRQYPSEPRRALLTCARSQGVLPSAFRAMGLRQHRGGTRPRALDAGCCFAPDVHRGCSSQRYEASVAVLVPCLEVGSGRDKHGEHLLLLCKVFGPTKTTRGRNRTAYPGMEGRATPRHHAPPGWRQRRPRR